MFAGKTARTTADAAPLLIYHEFELELRSSRSQIRRVARRHPRRVLIYEAAREASQG